MTNTQQQLCSTSQSQDKAGNVLAKLKLSLLRELSCEHAASILDQVKHLEKHNFPTSEAMKFTRELLKKPNTSVPILFYEEGTKPRLYGYAVVLRWQRRLLLHKVCVHSSLRRLGNGSRLMSDIITRARKASCSTIDLWVDEARTPAMRLYAKHGFEEVDRVKNYYSAGRTGIKMSLELNT